MTSPTERAHGEVAGLRAFLAERADHGAGRSDAFEVFDWLAGELSEQFLFAVVLGLEGVQLWMADSYSLEVLAPAGLQIRELRLIHEEQREGETTWVDSGRRGMPPGHVAHVNAHAGHLLASDWWGEVLQSPGRVGAVAAILLAAPAVLAGWLSRSPEHRLVGQVLRPPRRAILLSGALLFTASALVATGVEQPFRGTTWVVLVAIQGYSVVDLVRRRLAVHAEAYSGGVSEGRDGDGV